LVTAPPLTLVPGIHLNSFFNDKKPSYRINIGR
jgi:hypothetical protein